MKAAIRRAWVLDNLTKIGPGGFYHLAYAHSQIEPDFMRWIKENSEYGKIHVHLIGDDDTSLYVARGEVFAIHWFPEFIRIHFMIEVVRSADEATQQLWKSEYMLER